MVEHGAVTSGESLKCMENVDDSLKEHYTDQLPLLSPVEPLPGPEPDFYDCHNTQAKQTSQFIESVWLVPAAHQLYDVLTLCDTWVSLDFLQHCSSHAHPINGRVPHLTETIRYFGNGILECYLLPFLEGKNRVKIRKEEGRQEVAITDQQARDIVNQSPTALPTTSHHKDAARVLYLCLLEAMKMRNTPLALHKEILEHAKCFLSKIVKGLLTPVSVVHLALRMIEPLAKFKTLAEADECAACCWAQLLWHATPQLYLPFQMNPCLYKMYLVDAAVARARQQRRLGNPKASLELLDVAMSLESQIQLMSGYNYMVLRIQVAQAETLSYLGHYREALICLLDMEEIAYSNNDATDWCQYCLTRAGICYYLQKYKQSIRYYEMAIDCVKADDSFQVALVLSLAARVPASLQARNALGPYNQYLNEAEQMCEMARKLLFCHGNTHRYWGVLERSYAMVYLARATQIPEHEKSGVLLQSVQHASNALECLSAVYGPRNINVAMTLEIWGQIAAVVACSMSCNDIYMQVVVARLMQKYQEIASTECQCKAPIYSVFDLSRFFYRQAIDLYQGCRSDHPACLLIDSAMRQLS
jgi:tetratricopeptide (TPR) repeat protein